MKIFYPAPLRPGDKIALLSPASAVKEEYVMGAMERILERGYEPLLMPDALGPASGSFSSDKINRFINLVDALEDNEIKAILCNRGGYGCVQLLPNLSFKMVSMHPKWIIGFSDVSALLALWYKAGVASIHGPMAKHLASMPAHDKCTDSLFDILENGGSFSYEFPASKLNHCGEGSGNLIGGNLAVLNDLANTPCDLLSPEEAEGSILFFEDISEPIYAVERMLWRLELSGVLQKAKGLIFGQFTEYKPDRNYNSMEEMISRFLELSSKPEIPVVFDFPIGHTDVNYPLIVGAHVSLCVTPERVNLYTTKDTDNRI
ncbi:MAG: LD-carboxypeptidase [Muribaculaceae bacterium]|nr:LD-carboxypeptidase [Muribaculaceae bacterium]